MSVHERNLNIFLLPNCNMRNLDETANIEVYESIIKNIRKELLLLQIYQASLIHKHLRNVRKIMIEKFDFEISLS